jgi:hypothetical protein
VDGEIVSAGHFIAAILEHMGYLTQADYLEEFRSFFRDAGALIYFLAAVFSLISVLLYGSARAVRYLIVGPALYWFLVGPVTEVEGVVWKLGGGQERGILGQEGREAAEEGRDDVLENAGIEPRKNLRVATGFWLFAKPINDLVQELVDLFLDDEDGEALMVADKVRGLELISRMIPHDPGMIHRLEHGLLGQCGKSYHAALGSAETYIKNRATEGLPGRNRTENLERLDEISQKKLNDFNFAMDQMLQTNNTLFAAWIEVAGAGDSKYKKAQEAFDRDNNRALPEIKCSHAWDIFFEELLSKSAETVPDTLRLTSGLWNSPEGMERACRLLSRKIYDDAKEQECNLVPGIALATLWNHTSRGDTFGRVLARHSSYNDPLNPGDQIQTFTAMSQGYMPVMQEVGQSGIFGPVVQVASFAGHFSSKILTETVKHLPSGVVERVSEWAPNVDVYAINGIDHATYTSMPAYETNRVRQQLLTWALQMPYYQGILLYLIAIAYPFVCLLVLVPGRAENVLNIPLFWLWVKSWDVGFAAIILLEKVLYNMLPNWGMPNELRTTGAEGSFWKWHQLPLILGEGYNFNHIQGVALHYSVLAMCTMSIPVWTGVIVLKGKRSLLGNFTNAISNQARNAGARAAAAHSITSANERAQMMKQIKGAAIQMPRLQSGGVGGGLRGGSARGSAAAIVVSSQLKNASSSLEGKSMGAKSANFFGGMSDLLTGSATQFNRKYGERVGTEAKFESGLRAAHDPILGRWGKLQRFNDAYAAALDGGGAALQGGFETNDEKANAIDTSVEQFKARTKDITTIGTNIARAEGALIANSGKEFIGNILKGKESASSVVDMIAQAGVVVGALESYTRGEDSDVIALRKQAIAVVTKSIVDGTVADGYSGSEVASRMLSMGNGYSTPNSNAIYERMDDTSIIGALYTTLYKASGPVAGGTHTIGDYIGTLGGDRAVETMPAEEYNAKIANGEIYPTETGAHWSHNVTEFGKFVFDSIHGDGQNYFMSMFQDLNFDVPYHRTMRQEAIEKHEAMKITFPEKYTEVFNKSLNDFNARIEEYAMPSITFSGTEVEKAFQVVEWAKSVKPVELPSDERGNPNLQFQLNDDLREVAEKAPSFAINEVRQWLEQQHALALQFDTQPKKQLHKE